MAASLSRDDLGVLRGLAREVADIAALPAQSDATARWKALNGLRPVRPLVLIDEIPWHEMDVDGELALRTEDETARVFERALRETLYRWRHLPVDMVVEAAIDVPKVIRSSGFGIERDEFDAGSGPAQRDRQPRVPRPARRRAGRGPYPCPGGRA